MSSSKCTITFDNNPLGIYYAGQMVSGTAELVTTRPKTIRSIFITVSGFADVRWTETVRKADTEGKPQNAIETFSASEIYYSSDKYVYGQSGGSQLELPAGKYVFPFQATIPPNAPTSFNGQWGQIQHEATLVIDRVMRYNNMFKQAFSVISPYDLNLNPDNAKPLHKIEEKSFCWSLCCGSKGPMVMTVNVPFSSYAPGQKIRFNILFDNQSDISCSDVKVRLMKKVTYTSRSPETKTQVTEIKVADNHCGEVVKLNKAEFNEFLQIPSTTPTSLQSCSIIKVSYTLKFIGKVLFSTLLGNLTIEFPIIIGTVPLYASATEQGPVTAQPKATPAYKPLPPPQFEEDVRSEQFESNTFKPRYPVFLADADLNRSNNPGGTNIIPPTPQAANNLYPSPNIQPHKNPIPSPIPMPNQVPITPPPATIDVTTNSPTRPVEQKTHAAPVPVPVPTKTSNPSQGQKSPVEVLGFSVPPDYQPTPSAPPPAGGSRGIGWN